MRAHSGHKLPARRPPFSPPPPSQSQSTHDPPQARQAVEACGEPASCFHACPRGLAVSGWLPAGWAETGRGAPALPRCQGARSLAPRSRGPLIKARSPAPQISLRQEQGGGGGGGCGCSEIPGSGSGGGGEHNDKALISYVRARLTPPPNRGRLAEKRTIPLPPTRIPKKELSSIFSVSDGDSDGSSPAHGHRPDVKQEDDLHISIMKRRVHTHWDLNISFRETSCSRDSDLSTIISNLHQSRHLVMPERQSRCEFQRSSVEIGLGPAGYRPSSDRQAAEPCEAGSSPEHLRPSLPSCRGCCPGSACFSPALRDLTHPSLLSPQNAPHIALGPHLRPPFLGVPSALCQAPGYGFLQPAQAEMFARQQEILRKQSLARLEMSAELLRQKELETLHRPRLLTGDPLGLPQEHPALRTHEGPESHSLPPSSLHEDLQRRRSAMLVLRHSSAPLLALPPQGAPCPGPGPPTPPKEQARQRPLARKGAGRPGEAKEASGPGARAQDSPEDDAKESDSEDTEAPRAESGGGSRTCDGPKDTASGPSGDSPGQGLGGRAEGKGPLLGAPLPPPLPLSLPYAVSPYFHTGTMGGLFLDSGEEAVGPEDVSKWTVDDVCTFVGGLAGCGEYAPVFREQAIDGETLPLLTEEHLLTNMGLKLGPALKIRSHVAKRVGRLFYMASFPVAFPVQAPGLRGTTDRELPGELQPSSPANTASPFGGGFSASRGSPKQENGTPSLLVGMGDAPKPPS
ncbi:sterile alpha motif domain-containing protein 11 [Gracilinanus agilis]|uniref:sterile alpha motif domain-containing protein 11 n=1 Tax=Gracilinanus agilis TaxID=191870 RepID=UPI001CFF2E52|nr:sterile alpha motif domain-containing protein 11 [Gracilinanus agilis]